MSITDNFKEELELIKTDSIRNFVTEFLAIHTPNNFESKAASSSGKYHPTECNSHGGLILHTKYAVRSLLILLEAEEFSQRMTDICIAATILHDLFKYGVNGEFEHTIPNHGQLLADFIGNNYTGYNELRIAELIRTHMGKWTEDYPIDQYQLIVHRADMIASRVHTIVRP